MIFGSTVVELEEQLKIENDDKILFIPLFHAFLFVDFEELEYIGDELCVCFIEAKSLVYVEAFICIFLHDNQSATAPTFK